MVVGPLRDSFLRHLAAENRSSSTQVTYAAAIDLLAAFAAQAGMPALTELRREHIEAFLVDLCDKGQRPATLANRYHSLQQFYKWLLEEGEIKSSPMVNMRPPHVEDAHLSYERIQVFNGSVELRLHAVEGMHHVGDASIA